MTDSTEAQFSGPVTRLLGRRLPGTATPAGYCALIDAYGLSVPLPQTLYATGERHRTKKEDGWTLLTPRHAPDSTLEGHLTFALKYEGLDLAVLRRLFLKVGSRPIETIVQSTPTGSYARRIWFLYEWLTGSRLSLPDASGGRYVPVVDPNRQWTVEGDTVTRYRVRNNLPGTADFCPLVFRTERLDEYLEMGLQQKAIEIAGRIPRDLLARTAAFLLLKDSKASYAIEGQHPPQNRIQRWGRAIGEAGRHPIDASELLRLQEMVIGDSRFVNLGFRKEGGFVGEHDRATRMPLPVHISARPDDLPSLLDGMIAFDSGPAQALDPVIAAAVLAFGFVYVHPFEDGNGRIHRYLIHHTLARAGFNPAGLVFPVSAAILERIDEYREVLEVYSSKLLPLIEWEPTEGYNIRVLNATGDFYRFFDATAHVEFLYSCVRKTIEEDLPNESEFLRRYDAFRQEIEAIIEMPERLIDLLFRFLDQNGGHLSKRAREREFSELTDQEASQIEATYREVFGFTTDSA
ncbi:Fic family protein [Gemmatimonadota bacterium]